MTNYTCLILKWRLESYWWLQTQPSNSKLTGELQVPAQWFLSILKPCAQTRVNFSNNFHFTMQNDDDETCRELRSTCDCVSLYLIGMVWVHSLTGCWIALTRLLSLKWMIRASSSLVLSLASPLCWSLHKRPLVSIKLSSLLWRSVWEPFHERYFISFSDKVLLHVNTEIHLKYRLFVVHHISCLC